MVAAALVVLAVLIARRFTIQPRVTAPEPAWAQSPAPPQAPPPAPPPARVAVAVAAKLPELAQNPERIAPVVPCVPVRVKSGASKIYSGHLGQAPLRIKTPSGDNYLIKLVQKGTRRVVMSAYMAGGDTKEFKVPLGTYSIFYARGQVWCGAKREFGKGARLMRLVGDFAFTRDSDGFGGLQIELVPQILGNLKSEEVSDEEFAELQPATPEAASAQ